ncbi:MAG TPA: AmmeMemoRadiSam system protein B [Terriglobales bacterium]|nr:AmmeMemoRadiSam system protein B [Terriglobales bacterium]HXR16444.1 AmmeMemoRadiSam system protein B [Terriglobales bacterium]
MTSALRTPAVAGRFYPGRAVELLREVREYTSAGKTPVEAVRIAAIGCVAPHAGYIYSGGVAGAVYSRLEIPKRCVILCPNHTGKGRPLSIMANTTWQTPLGEVAADAAMGARLLRRFPALEENSAAHRAEHAIEVQLPFLQARQPELNIVPIVIGTSDFEVLRGLGDALADVIAGLYQENRQQENRQQEEDRQEKVLIVASSDMNHYESDAVTRVKDHKAIERVLAMDARGLWEVVMNEDISMCGFGPTIVMLTAAKLLGATAATLVKYATSGEVSGDYESVVGYAGIIVE